ncbi:MAG TPA: sodium ion-translocating decarboxylase subunit beta, partial [Clostridiales bacterium]|nr:sodium ion-translocating decarboxylase subunit beta [Clostridiales bacterium]
LGALALGFNHLDSASIGIIGGADGPTSIFIASILSPHLLGPIAIAAYSYMALVPVIQPPFMKILTTKKEKLIRMKAPRKVTKREKILFPIIAFIVSALIAPGSITLIGMLMLGNLIKESGVTDRLSKTAGSAILDTATIILSFSVGASTQASTFVTKESLMIFGLGLTSFCIATASGLIFAKIMNLFLKEKINPLIGAAGVSAVPDSARVVHHFGLHYDKNNFLLGHAMAPNVAGVIGSAIAAGVFIAFFAK